MSIETRLLDWTKEGLIGADDARASLALEEMRMAAAEIERLRGLLHECLSFALGAPIGWSSDLWERVTKTLSEAP